MKIVDSYQSLTLGMYERIRQIIKDTDDELERQVKVIAVLADMDERDVLALPIAEYKRMVIASEFLADIDPSSYRVAKSYTLGGLKLIPITDYRKIITSQYVDFQELTKDGDLDDHLVELLSIILVPEGKVYADGYDIAEVQTAIRAYMPAADATALLAFFFARYERLIAASLRYSMRAAKGLKDKTARRTLKERIAALLRRS